MVAQSLLAVTLLFIGTALSLVAPSVAAGMPVSPGPYDVCRSVAESNVLDPKSGWMRPAPAYGGNWLRDAFWTTGILGPEEGRRAQAQFGARLAPDGRAPTKLEPDDSHPIYYDDESTLLYVLWAGRDGGQPLERVVGAWNWIGRHVSNGDYWTPTGNFHTWHDNLLFPSRDVASYNQGLYVAAAIAANRLGIAKQSEVDAAANAYRRLYRLDLGYLPTSRLLDYHDASALTGEFLARSLFKRSILDDDEVVSTVRNLTREGDGFLVLSARAGNYLDPSAFFMPMEPGRYQNGGSWLLYDAMSWSAAWMAGADEARGMALKRLMAEAADGTLYEYLPTGQADGKVPLNSEYGWNSYAWLTVGQPQDSYEPVVRMHPAARDAGVSARHFPG
jgi:hypothetical protein